MKTRKQRLHVPSSAPTEIAALLALHPAGAEAKVIANKLQRNHEAVTEWLRTMRADGLVCKWPDTFGPCKWCLPRDLATAKAAYTAYRVVADKASLARKAKAQQKRMAAKVEARLRETDSEDDKSGFYAAPIMRIVPAHCAPPLRPRGPASVWELAA